MIISFGCSSSAMATSSSLRWPSGSAPARSCERDRSCSSSSVASISSRSTAFSSGREPAVTPHGRGRDHQAVTHRVFREELRQLERASDAETRDLARVASGDVGPVEVHVAAVGLEEAGADVDEGRLARAVLADDGKSIARHQVEVDRFGGHDAAELQRQAARAQQAGGRLDCHAAPPWPAAGFARSRFSTRPKMPVGATNTMTIRTRPRTSCHAVSSAAA